MTEFHFNALAQNENCWRTAEVKQADYRRHRCRANPALAVEITHETKLRQALDDERSWSRTGFAIPRPQGFVFGWAWLRCYIGSTGAYGGSNRIMNSGNMSEQFDVFISHNSQDKPTVRELVNALNARGLRVWRDEDQLQPGQPWQEALEAIIQTTKAAAVLVGKDGLGP